MTAPDTLRAALLQAQQLPCTHTWQVLAMFDALDADGSGSIDAGDIRARAARHGSREAGLAAVAMGGAPLVASEAVGARGSTLDALGRPLLS